MLKDDCMPCHKMASCVASLHAKGIYATQKGCAARIDAALCQMTSNAELCAVEPLALQQQSCEEPSVVRKCLTAQIACHNAGPLMKPLQEIYCSSCCSPRSSWHRSGSGV